MSFELRSISFFSTVLNMRSPCEKYQRIKRFDWIVEPCRSSKDDKYCNGECSIWGWKCSWKSAERQISIRLGSAWGPGWPCRKCKKKTREIKRTGKGQNMTKHWTQEASGSIMKPLPRASIRCSASMAVCQRGISVRCGDVARIEQWGTGCLRKFSKHVFGIQRYLWYPCGSAVCWVPQNAILGPASTCVQAISGTGVDMAICTPGRLQVQEQTNRVHRASRIIEKRQWPETKPRYLLRFSEAWWFQWAEK